MKKLHLFAFYAMVTPVIALGAGAGSVLAQSGTQGLDRGQQSSEQQGTSQSRPGSSQDQQGTSQSRPGSSQRDQSSDRPGLSGSQAGDRQGMGSQAHAQQSRGNIDSVPSGGMQASDLIGADLKTTGDEDLGSVDDLIIDENGQIVAIVVSVGGFLGMGQRDVAIGWDNVQQSGTGDDQELRVNMSRDELRSAPKFDKDKRN